MIYVFSGTGNTLRAAEATAACLRSHNIKTLVYRIEKTDAGIFPEIPDPNRYDIAAFAYPVHAFNAPQFFLRFVKQLPDLQPENKDRPAYVFKTSGEPFRPNTSSSFALCRLLKKKGFVPLCDMHMLMPYNIMFRYPDAMAKQMYLHTMQVMVPRLAEFIAAGSYEKPHFNPLRVLFSCILRLQWFGAWINGPLQKADRALCTGCGKCAHECPSKNIRMQSGFPAFGRQCIMCMRCVMNCPKNAIKPGILTKWKVYPAWDFDRLMKDVSIPSSWTDNPHAGYFRLFRNYYKKNAGRP